MRWPATTTGEQMRFTTAVLAAAGVAMVVWSHPVVARVPVVTVGRVLLVLGFAALLYDLRHPRRWVALARQVLRGPSLLLIVAGVFTLILVVISSHTTGCQCSGGLYGFAEMELWGLLALLAVAAAPGTTLVLIGGAVAGAVLAGALALGGVRAAGEVSTHTARLLGTYGNPNFLAAAQAVALPAAVAAAIAPARLIGDGLRSIRSVRAVRVVALACAVVLALVNFLTYSRSGLLAAVFGAYIAFVILLPSRRRIPIALLAAVVGVGVAAALYRPYSTLRTEADFGTAASQATLADGTGWAATATGLIQHSGAVLRNAGSAGLMITARQAGEGASYPVGSTLRGVSYRVRFQARAVEGGLSVGYGIEDNLVGAGPVQRTIHLAPRFHTYTLRWVPARAGADARVYVWTKTPGALVLRSLSVSRSLTSGAAAGTGERLRVPAHATSSPNLAVLNHAEAGFVQSRQSALHLALVAFLNHPLSGIGWERFPAWAGRRLKTGAIATHNEYVRFPAELGIGGLIGIVLLCVATAWAAFRLRRHPRAGAVIGMLVAAAVVLAFANLLEAPAAGLAIATACAIAAGLASRLDAGARRVAAVPGALQPRPRGDQPGPGPTKQLISSRDRQ